MKFKQTKAFKVFWIPLWENNPVAVQVLGICSALAVTVQLKTAFVMGISLTLVVALSNLIISSMRKLIPRNIRMIAELVVVASLVIVADQFLRAFMYDISKQLSVFVGLIITNCIVMGRAESFAMANPPFLSFMDGLGNGLGYSTLLIFVAFIREFLGAGKLFGFQIVPNFLYNLGYENMGLMLLAPGAFFIIGLLVWAQRSFGKKKA